MKIEKYGTVTIDESRVTISGWTIDAEGAMASIESPLGIEDLILDWAVVQIANHRDPLNRVTISGNTVE